MFIVGSGTTVSSETELSWQNSMKYRFDTLPKSRLVIFSVAGWVMSSGVHPDHSRFFRPNHGWYFVAESLSQVPERSIWRPAIQTKKMIWHRQSDPISFTDRSFCSIFRHRRFIGHFAILYRDHITIRYRELHLFPSCFSLVLVLTIWLLFSVSSLLYFVFRF